MRSIVHILFAAEEVDFRGGVTKAVYELATAQMLAGRSVEIWAPGERGSSTWISSTGVRFRTFRSYKAGPFKFVGGLRKALWTAGAVSVVHTHNVYEGINIQAALYAWIRGIPYFAHTHGAVRPDFVNVNWRKFTARDFFKSLYFHLVESRIIERARRVIALSSAEAASIRECGVRTSIDVITNGMFMDFTPMPASLYASLSPAKVDSSVGARLLFIGRINPVKRIELMIQALSRIRKSYPDVTLSIAGAVTTEPAYKRALDDLVAALDLKEHVHWLGYAGPDAKQQLMGSATVFLHTSVSEGMSMAILEAMANRMPVVVTPGCGMSNAAEAGALIQADETVGSIVDAVCQLIEDSSLRQLIGDNARQYVARHHSWQSIVVQYDALYDACDISV